LAIIHATETYQHLLSRCGRCLAKRHIVMIHCNVYHEVIRLLFVDNVSTINVLFDLTLLHPEMTFLDARIL
jgi:hypothetical protein